VNNGVLFIAKVNPHWWSDLKNMATEVIGKKDGEYTVLYSTKLEEFFMMYNSRSEGQKKIKKKCVLTNAFICIGEKKDYGIISFCSSGYLISYCLEINSIKLCYELYFNGNDVFNHYLAQRYFPNNQRSGWESNYTDFLFAAYQMNFYTLWHEITKQHDRIDRIEFTKMLYRGLMNDVKRRRTESKNEHWL
jgi:hypothetical protein